MEEEKVVKSGFASDMGDVPGSLVVLAIALFFLCFALYWIVRILHYLVLSSGRRVGENGEQTPFMKITQKILGMHPVLDGVASEFFCENLYLLVPGLLIIQ